MNLDALANIGEIIGALAVVISLAYVALQVRQNTIALRMANYANAVQRIGALQSEVSQHPDLLRAWSTGLQDPDSLNVKQRLQMNWSLYSAFGDLEFLYIAAQKGALPEEIWERWDRTLSWWLAMPGVRAWWQALATPFTRSFTDYVNREIAQSRMDPAAVERFNHFIAHGTAASDTATGSKE